MSPLNPELVVSTCAECGAFVGAAPSQTVLRVAEGQHNCRPVPSTAKHTRPAKAKKKK